MYVSVIFAETYPIIWLASLGLSHKDGIAVNEVVKEVYERDATQ